VSAETWQSFRQLAIRRGLTVTTYLAKLVEAEVRRHSSSAVAAIPIEAPPADEALAALAEVRRSIDELDDIAGRLARSAVRNGGSWNDVGSSLRLQPEHARRAYDAR
jgi:hypothetical protein